MGQLLAFANVICSSFERIVPDAGSRVVNTRDWLHAVSTVRPYFLVPVTYCSSILFYNSNKLLTVYYHCPGR